MCDYEMNMCFASDSNTCLASSGCKLFGACSLKSSLEPWDPSGCEALHDEDCQGAMICEETGACTAFEGSCTATTEEDCQASGACAQDGACVLQGAVCVPSQEGCQGSLGCADEGRCSLNESYAVCAALTDEDCAGSEICASLSLCVAQTDCGADSSCEIWGQCVEVNG